MLVQVPPDLTDAAAAQFALDCWEGELRQAEAALDRGDAAGAEDALGRASVWRDVLRVLARGD
jgi:hypothetical protein